MTRDTPFGSLVRHRRAKLGMSQAGLADLVGRSASAVRSWERGSSTPTDGVIVRSLAAILGLDEGELLSAAGIPADDIAEGPEVVGGKGLLAFSQETAEDALSTEAGSGEISWDDVAESVRAGAPKDRFAAAQPEQLPDEPPAPAAAETSGVEGPEEQRVDEPGRKVPEDLPGDRTASRAAEDEPVVLGKSERRVAEPDPIAPVAAGRVRVEPAVPAPTTASSPTAVMLVEERVAPPVANAYIDDPDQMMTYWIRAALTVAVTMFLVIVLFWALGNLGDSIGEVWDLFKATS